MKIDVIFTGGTIGSSINNDGNIAADGSVGYKLIDLYRKQKINNRISTSFHGLESGRDVIFLVSEPYRILSENISAGNIISLVREVDRLIAAGSEGIIITHGTDTIQYTAAILQYLFGEVDIPVVIVSAAYILDDPRTNGVDNFACAVEFIAGRYGSGVFVSYRNCVGLDDEDVFLLRQEDSGQFFVSSGDCNRTVYIHRANRLLGHAMYTDGLYSVCGSWYGRFHVEPDGIRFERNENYHVSDDNICGLLGNYISNVNEFKLSEYSDGITVIKPYVGMRHPEKLSGSTKVVLIESFHSGTVPTGDESFRLMCDDAKSRGIPVFLTGLAKDEKHYETAAEYGSLGIVPIKEMSSIAAYCKLWIIVSNGLDIGLMEKPVSEDYPA